MCWRREKPLIDTTYPATKCSGNTPERISLMSNVLIINGHQPFAFSKGSLNAELVRRAKIFFEAKGDAVRLSKTSEPYHIDQEIETLNWADVVLLQYPLNWMGVPWSLKKYIDDVFSAGMDGRLMDGDGRSEDVPKKNYGMGGKGQGTKYMQSVTLNAPSEAFDDATEPFLRGLSLDDVLLPMHLNFKILGYERMPTFAAYDVMKNPEIENDFSRFSAHLERNFGKTAALS